MKENVPVIGVNTDLLLSDEHRERFIQSIKVPFEIAKTITGRKTPLLLYGGAVRNLLLNTETSMPDYDFIGDFDPDQIQKDFSDLIIGRWNEVQTMRLKIGNSIYDFTWAKDIKERLSIGDITTSNMCMSEDGQIIDYFGGLESLIKKEIKIINPEEKIKTDPARILRVFRFAVELGFTIEEDTLNAIIANANLLTQIPSSNEDLWQIISLEPSISTTILSLLRQYGLDRYLTFPHRVYDSINTAVLEKEIMQQRQIEKVAQMFGTTTYLVGGAIRDMIWGKNVNDLDFKIHLPVGEIIQVLEANGFKKSDDYHTKEHEYYVSVFAGVVGAVIDGVDVHLSQVDTTDIATLISEGDINFSCCAFNIHTKKFENPEKMSDIRNKVIRFANPLKAKDDPIIIINALKQISRIPEIIIPEETQQIITECIPKIVNFFEGRLDLRYKIESLCGNINSEFVYQLFTNSTADIFQSLEKKREKLKVSCPKYISIALKELTKEDRKEIVCLLQNAYGSHFDKSKAFSENVNSVVIEKDNGKIQSCCLVDGERLYSVAAKNSSSWINIVAELAKNNYNVWGTVDCNNPKIQALCSVAGLAIETNPNVIRKILETKSKKYRNISIYESGGMTVFRKNDKADDYPQVLLRS